MPWPYKRIRVSRDRTVDEHRIVDGVANAGFNTTVHHNDGNEKNNLPPTLTVLDRSSHAKTMALAPESEARYTKLSKVDIADSRMYPRIYWYLTNYVVSYTRSDGKNQEGVDIPYSFDGTLTSRVQVGQQTDISFVVVRAVSKLEPPLIDLASGRGEGELKTTARIDFYGHDTLGNTVTATGYLTIFFANYITSEEEPGGGGN